jgi:hypothetical protein
MKKIICLLAFLTIFTSKPFAQKEKNSIESSIIRFFDGLSEFNNDKLRDCSSSDFLLLEDGMVWNLDTLINKMSPRKNLNIERVNKFQFIKTEQSGNIAWVSYHNTAEFKLNDKQQTVRWLETAILTKEKGKWKIKLLHSTKLK